MRTILNILIIVIILIIPLTSASAAGNNLSLNTISFQQDSTTTDSLTSIFESTGSPVVVPSLLKTAFYLIIVALLIGVTVYVLKWMFFNRGGKSFTASPVKIIGSTYLSPKRTVHILKIADRVIVVGSTDQQVSMLTELNENEIQEYEKEHHTSETGKPFSYHFNNFLGKAKHKE